MFSSQCRLSLKLSPQRLTHGVTNETPMNYFSPRVSSRLTKDHFLSSQISFSFVTLES